MRKMAKSGQHHMNGNKKTSLILFGVIGALAVAAVIVFVVVYYGGLGGGGAALSTVTAETPGNAANQPSTDPGVADPAKATPTPPKDISQVTLDQPFDAATSPDVPTVTEVRANLKARGFEDAVLSVTYDISGTYSSRRAITYDSKDKYPSYMVDYYTKDDNLWYIYINNGIYIARPMFGGDETNVAVLVTEADYLTGYEGGDNSYTNTAPDATTTVLKKVNIIDATTLDNLTVEELLK